MKTAQDFGSHWTAKLMRRRLNETAETTCDSEDDYLGFRLVHDSSDRVIRGGYWNFGASYTRGANRNRADPGNRYGSLGFRLCVGWREE